MRKGERVLIRVDGDRHMGLGHAMRCLAIAQANTVAGGATEFACAALPSTIIARFADVGFPTHNVSATAGSDEDADETVALARMIGARWVVVDGYQFHSRYIQRLENATLRVLVIDDLAVDAPYAADLVLNQSLGADPSNYEDRSDATRLLLGPRYALLRPEFRERPSLRESRTFASKRVLVTMGGSDPQNVTATLVRALMDAQIPDLELVAVVGAGNPNGAALASEVQGDDTIRIVADAFMPSLLEWADLAIGAGGITSWEFAYAGVPAILIPIAENQLPNAQQLHDAGVVQFLGWFASVTPAAVVGAVTDLLDDVERRKRMSDRGRALVDGDGPSRVIDAMRRVALQLRPARLEDAELLWHWANDPTTRAASFSSEPIPWETHLQWFRRRLSDSATRTYIAMDEGRPVAQIRYDLADGGAVVSLNVAMEERGRGLATDVITLGSEAIFASTEVSWIDAYVRQENVASLRAFRKAGFEIAGQTNVEGAPSVKLRANRPEGGR